MNNEYLRKFHFINIGHQICIKLAAVVGGFFFILVNLVLHYFIYIFTYHFYFFLLVLLFTLSFLNHFLIMFLLMFSHSERYFVCVLQTQLRCLQNTPGTVNREGNSPDRHMCTTKQERWALLKQSGKHWAIVVLN